MQLALKVAILATGKTQREIAASTNIPENRLSDIVRGWREPRADERITLAAALGRSVDELFEVHP